MGSHEDLAAVVVRTVKAARRALGWSQRELAARAGVSQTLVARFERGQTAAVSLATIEALFDALGVRADLRTDLPVIDPRQSDAVHAGVGGFLGRRLEGHAFEIGTKSRSAAAAFVAGSTCSPTAPLIAAC
jgi:transcriptional regulator with XRE-family HTH domain